MIASLKWATLQKQYGGRLNPVRDTGLWMHTIARGFFDSLSGILQGILNVTVGSAVHFQRTGGRDAVHKELIDSLCSDFDFDDKEKKQLDGVVNNFLKTFEGKNLNVESSATFSIIGKLVPTIKIPGSEVETLDPQMKFFLIEMKGNTFTEIKNKRSTTTFHVDIQQVCATGVLNEDYFRVKEAALRRLWSVVSNKAMEDFAKDSGTSLTFDELREKA